jgi:hypothetical protein
MAARLTETEARLMRLAAAGLTADEIAIALELDRPTVAGTWSSPTGNWVSGGTPLPGPAGHRAALGQGGKP